MQAHKRNCDFITCLSKAILKVLQTFNDSFVESRATPNYVDYACTVLFFRIRDRARQVDAKESCTEFHCLLFIYDAYQVLTSYSSYKLNVPNLTF